MAKINSRNKGATFERWVVNQFKAAGYHAIRTAPMQAGHPQHAADVEVYEYEGGPLFLAIECKAWGKQPSDRMVEDAVKQAATLSRHAEFSIAVIKQNQRAPFAAFNLPLAKRLKVVRADLHGFIAWWTVVAPPASVPHGTTSTADGLDAEP